MSACITGNAVKQGDVRCKTSIKVVTEVENLLSCLFLFYGVWEIQRIIKIISVGNGLYDHHVQPLTKHCQVYYCF